MSISHYNNLIINSFALHSVLNEAKYLSFAQTALILPVISHKEMIKSILKYRKIDFMKYFIENIDHFSNFNDRYQSSLINTVNSLQFLYELKIIEFHEDKVNLVSPLPPLKNVGRRAKEISKASKNLATLLSGDVEIFYLNARIIL